MGILDNIIGRSPFLSRTQGFLNPQQPAQPVQAPPPAMPQPGSFANPQQQQQGGQQGGGIDLGMIAKIISMFGGM